jgi:hypothetical protein
LFLLLSQNIQKIENRGEHDGPVAFSQAQGHDLVDADNKKSYRKRKQENVDQFHAPAKIAIFQTGRENNGFMRLAGTREAYSFTSNSPVGVRMV